MKSFRAQAGRPMILSFARSQNPPMEIAPLVDRPHCTMPSQDWQSKPPYQSPSGAAHFSQKVRGSCQCEKVIYWLNSNKPLASKFCHCTGCQVLHGKKYLIQLLRVHDKKENGIN
jgi:hypothetical protein